MVSNDGTISISWFKVVKYYATNLRRIVFLVKSTLVLLGIVTILVGKYLSLKIIMTKIEKYKVVDERDYVK